MVSQADDAGSGLRHLVEVDSTNAEAMRLSAGGERGPLWILADRQNAARGRSGRAWATSDGNLAASYLFEPQCKPEALHQLALLTGVAVHGGIAKAVAKPIEGLRLKWPNDIFIGRAKAGGILVETTIVEGRISAVIGIGLNIKHAPSIEGRDVTHLAATAPDLNRDLLFKTLRMELQHWLHVWHNGAGFTAVRDAWLARAGAIGEGLAVNAGHQRIEGAFQGIDSTGALLLRDADGIERRLTYGDVSLTTATGVGPERTTT